MRLNAPHASNTTNADYCLRFRGNCELGIYVRNQVLGKLLWSNKMLISFRAFMLRVMVETVRRTLISRSGRIVFINQEASCMPKASNSSPNNTVAAKLTMPCYAAPTKFLMIAKASVFPRIKTCLRSPPFRTGLTLQCLHTTRAAGANARLSISYNASLIPKSADIALQKNLYPLPYFFILTTYHHPPRKPVSIDPTAPTAPHPNHSA